MGARGEIPGAGQRGHFRELVKSASHRQPQLRMLAPASLGAFLVILLIVVIASVGGGSDTGTAERERTGDRPRRAQQARDRPAPRPGRRVYVVRAGDTLAKIAERTGVDVAELLQLNPSIDPRAMVTGQRIKLR